MIILRTEKVKLRENKKILKRIAITTGIVIFAIGAWFAYTLANYDAFFSPHYLIDLSNPDKYYQENISDYLIKNGQEFKIDDVDTSDWRTYKSQKHNFSFKYPNDFEVESPNEDLNYIFFIRRDRINKDVTNISDKCEVVVSYGGGWAISMPRTRNWISEGKPLWYILHNKLAYPILNTRDEDIEEKIKSGKFNQSVEILFFKGEEHNFIVFEGNCGIDMFKGVLSTVKF